ncbi:MAG: prolipoprotein diacylglyceryl transferase [Polyangiaceae bacterium]|nr:prolipoprotein diacylglyceryl transferase [Polyangiaceae bacterium]
MTIPKGPIIGVLAVVGLLVFVNGLRRKAADLQTLGAIMLGAAALVWKLLEDGFGLRYYSLIFVAVFLGGYALFNWQVKRGGGQEEEAADFIVYGVLGVLIGARLGHVIFYDYAKALRDPAWIFKIWTGGLASHGAVLGLIAAMWLFTVRRGVPFLEGSDRFAFSAALGASLVRIGNFFNSEIIGKPTDQSWGVRLIQIEGPEGPLRYPTQLYEAALGLGVLALLIVIDRWSGREKRPRGLLIASFFALYFTGRFFVEFYKDYQEGMASPESPLSMGQWLSIPGALLGYYGVYWSLRRKIPVGWTAASDDEEDDEEEGEEDEEQDEDDDGESEEANDEKAAEDDRGSEDAEPERTPRKKRKSGKRAKSSRPSQRAEASPSIDPDVEEEFGPNREKRRRVHEGDLESEKK